MKRLSAFTLALATAATAAPLVKDTIIAKSRIAKSHRKFPHRKFPIASSREIWQKSIDHGFPPFRMGA